MSKRSFNEMPPMQFICRMHERVPWESRNVYNRDIKLNTIIVKIAKSANNIVFNYNYNVLFFF
jgi:hypothetical protein